MADPRLQIFVSCAPGIEPLLSAECQALGLTRVKETLPEGSTSAGEDAGGMLLQGSLQDVYRCNLHLRTASRVTVRLSTFHAVSFAELRKKAARLDWGRYFLPGQELNISVTCHKSRLYHSDAVAERVLGAINDAFITQKAASKP
jgi:putative N6-adenine-specific DNA methylase